MSFKQVLKKTKAHTKTIVGLRFVRDPETGVNYLISTGLDSLKVWQIDGFGSDYFGLNLRREVSAGRCSVQHFDVSPTGRLLGVVGVDSTLRRIVLNGDSLEPQIEQHNTGFMDMRFCALIGDGFVTMSFTALKIVGLDGQVKQSAEIDQSHIRLKYVTSIAVNASGNQIALGSCEGHVCLVDGVTLKSSPNFEAHMKRIREMTFLENDERLLTCCDDRTIRLHNIVDRPQKKALKSYCGHTSIVTGISVDRSSNDQRFVSCANDMKCILWDVKTAEKLHIFDNSYESPINCIVISGNGKYVSYGCDDGTVFVNELPSTETDSRASRASVKIEYEEMQIDQSPASPQGIAMEA